WSEWFRFRTAAREPAPFRFVYFGDAQNAILPYWAPVLRAAFARAPDVRFLLHAGDLVSHARSDEEWGEWFDAGGWLHGMLPSIPALGNHEYSRDAEEEWTVTPHWRAQFTLPENGPAGLEEMTYYIDYQGVRLIALESNQRIAAQGAWLDRVLSANPHRWSIVTFHHPIYSGAEGRDNPELRASWKPILEGHGVDLVLQGHDHTYARGRSGQYRRESGKASAPDGQAREAMTVYVVSVSGPKLYDLTADRWMERAGAGMQLYQLISIGGDTLRYEAYTADDRLYDAFDLIKQPGRDVRLIDRAPADRPERLEP
ncbi:MAG: metallophosphoesterase, partial [Candidatus Eisenbacteria bacterium]|nr:metallophosphoesterase [Candidatus Eisenbacteria bacterium]